jgi:hypothetical protein
VDRDSDRAIDRDLELQGQAKECTNQDDDVVEAGMYHNSANDVASYQLLPPGAHDRFELWRHGRSTFSADSLILVK